VQRLAEGRELAPDLKVEVAIGLKQKLPDPEQIDADGVRLVQGRRPDGPAEDAP